VRAHELAPAIAAVVRERGPARARDVLAVLRLQGRVSSRPTFDEAQDAALLLTTQGTLEHVRRAGVGERRVLPRTGRRSPPMGRRRHRRVPGVMTVQTLNVGAASAERTARILAWLGARLDDIVVLTETSAGAGTTLLAGGLRDLGYVTSAQPWGEQRDRGVFVASRVPGAVAADACLPVTLPWRLAELGVDIRVPFMVVGGYVPSRDRSAVKIDRKRAFIRSLLDALKAMRASERGRVLLVGDYNTVARSHIPRLPGLMGFEHEMHEELHALGFAPAHALPGMQPQPWSWIGRTGTGYLYDYVRAGADLHGRVLSCAYLHDSRALGLTDHAGVLVGLAAGATVGDPEATPGLR
jgi:exodeoxyribonuclease-3